MLKTREELIADKSTDLQQAGERQSDKSFRDTALTGEQLNNFKGRRPFPIGFQFIISLLILAGGSCLLMYEMSNRGYYASGFDTWGHLFKADLLYHNIIRGNYYPLFTSLWYNGVQPYRYWAPLPYYLLAFLQLLAKGDMVTAYYYFAGFSFFFGGLGWLLWGISTRRMKLCTFLSLIWFFLPENIRVFFCDGNVPRMVTAIIIPYLVYFIWLFVQKNKNYTAFFITVITAFLALTHLMISAMIGVTTFIFLTFYVIGTKRIRRPIEVIISMLIGYVLTGIWFIPALSGGIISMNSNEIAKLLIYPLWSTLNPLTRIVGVTNTYYYGISVILISLLGIMIGNKKYKAGYYANLLILIGTTPVMLPVLSKLPLSQVLWMTRFTTIAYAYFLWSLIEWKQVRRYFTLILMVILLVDCIPSFMLSKYYLPTNSNMIDEVATTKEITDQRATLLDLSSWHAYPSYQLCTGDNPKQYTFGWAWQGASTASNIVMINTALENGDYEYMFDRCVELGDDTVVVLKDLVALYNETEEHLLRAAGASGYSLYKETNEAYILHFNAPKSFAVLTEYKGIAIGKYANQIEYSYPVFTGGSDNIEDYTIDELSKYQTVYLSGFQYYNRENAEKMVTKLADRGIRVVIDMTHVPIVKENKRMYFLGVVAQDIEFTSSYPTLSYKGKDYYASSFPKEYSEWNTKYLEGVKNVLGTADYHGQKLTFAGTNDNKNIIFLGFNLVFYSLQADDKETFPIVNDCFNTTLYELPKRTIIPIKVQYTDHKLVIDTPVTNVNTTIAFQDNFASEDGIYNRNNLLYVSKKHTEIRLVYPHLKQAVAVSAAGAGIFILWMIIIAVTDRDKKKLRTQGDE